MQTTANLTTDTGTPWFEPTRNWGYGGLIIDDEKIVTRDIGAKSGLPHVYEGICYL
jgi:hypothetical protein